VVDDSFSMGASDNGVVRMERAAARMRGVLGFYGTGDEVSLVTASEQPQVVMKRADAGRGGLAAELDRLEVSFYASDLSGGLRLAESILEEAEGKKREICLVTDMQSLAWDRVASTEEEAGRKDIDLFLIDVGTPDQRNLAVTRARAEETGGGTARERGVTVRFRVEGFGPIEDESAVLREVLGGREEASATVRPRRGQPVEQAFTNWIREEGPVAGYGELEPDPLEVDNRRFFVHGGGGERTVLVLEGNPGGEGGPAGRAEAFYLGKALEVLAGDRSLRVREESVPEALERSDFSAYHLVILVDVPTLTERSALGLRKYLEEGGQAVVFLGPRVHPIDYGFLLYPDIVPFAPASPPRVPSPPVGITQRLPDHPLFQMFNEESIDLSEAAFQAYWVLEAEGGQTGRALAWYSDDGAALVESRAGAGKAVVFTSTPGPPWNDLAGRPEFVPFIGELLDYMLEGEGQRSSLTVGETAVLRITGEEGAAEQTVSIELSHPGGEVELLSATLSSGSATRFFDGMRRPGIYRFAASGDGPAVTVAPAAIAVNVDPAESDLRTIEVDEALDRLTAFRTEALESRRLESAVAAARRGRPMWDYVLLLALVLLVAETVYGNRVRKSPRGGARGAGSAEGES